MSGKFFVVAGQSNALRIAQREDVQTYLEGSSQEGDVVSRTQGATTLAPVGKKNDWYPFEDGNNKTGELLRALINDIDAHLEANPDDAMVSVLWVQGEGDAKLRRYNAYEERLDKLISVLREKYGENFVFTISQLSENMPAADVDGYRAGWPKIQQAQQNIADKYDFVTIIDPDDVFAAAGVEFDDAREDWIHYNETGSQLIADAFMRQFEAVGTGGADTLFGDVYDNKIQGRSGSDTIFANAGDDVVAGQHGNDKIHGNDGNDFLLGGTGNDRLYGDAGHDTITGGRGHDKIYGGDGDDSLQGDRGSDQIYGGAGNDTMLGGDGFDFIFSGEGNNQIDGGAHRDTVAYHELDFDLATIAATDTGITVTHGGGMDQLTSIERLEFADGSYEVDLQIFTPYEDGLL